ncbi:MAG: GspH/FimT family pseudopilin [Deltaproteobacteria bacterium]|nr:GspH/FimT family pseudopilin [Deltaproteobacteria bacterium]
MNRSGFTLLELLVVLVLIGLAAAMAAPRLSVTHEKLPLTTAAKNLSALLRLARSRAVTQGHSVLLYADPESGRIVMIKAGDLTQTGEEPKTIQDTDVRRFYRLPEGVTVRRVVSEGAVPLEDSLIASFSPIGNSSGGQVVLTDKAGRQKIIEIDSITGVVTILS